MNHGFSSVVSNPDAVVLLDHENGIHIDDRVKASFPKTIKHNPADINKAREYAELNDAYPIGLFYQNKEAQRYDEYGAHNLNMPVKQRLSALNEMLDRYAI
jgi:2-oxoglutarate ferredoxin oxidoreductase subunit beta